MLMITENSSKPPLPTALIIRSSYRLHVLLRFLFLLFDLLLQYFVVDTLPLRRLMKRRWRGCEQIVNSRAADALLNVICLLTRAPSMIALSCSNTRCCSFLKPVIPNRWTSRRAWSMRTHTSTHIWRNNTLRMQKYYIQHSSGMKFTGTKAATTIRILRNESLQTVVKIAFTFEKIRKL